MFTKADIEKYFVAEKQESFLFLVIGIVAVLVAIAFLLLVKTNFYRGAAVPLLVIGLVQAIAGYTVYARSDKDRIRNVYALDMSPQDLKQKEWPRIKTVVKKFAIYRWIEIVLALAGLALIILYRSKPDQSFLFGIGATLTIQALLLFGGDFIAESRAKEYSRKLQTFVNRQ